MSNGETSLETSFILIKTFGSTIIFEDLVWLTVNLYNH